MAAGDRSVSDLLQDILRNVQDIVRAEVRLAKTEVWEETKKAKSSALWLGAGTVSAVFAMLILLLMIMYLLALVMPTWAAALIVGAGLAVTAAVLLIAGTKRFNKIHPIPERTVETIKERRMGQAANQIEAQIEIHAKTSAPIFRSWSERLRLSPIGSITFRLAQ